MDLSIVVLNYKTKDLLKTCLHGIVDSPWSSDHEIIVVDNDSRDGSFEMVRKHFPTVRVIASHKNVGFAAGMNLALKQASGRYILTLNPDVSISGDAVAILRDYVEKHPRVGLAAPRVNYPDGTEQTSCYRFPNIWIPALRRTPLGHLAWGQNILERYSMHDLSQERDKPVGWVLGACMLIRQAAIDEVGAFDERFFLYFEDVDLCRRLWQAGWEVHNVREAKIVHYHQRLSAEYSGLKSLLSYPTRVHILSAIKYFSKYLGAAKPPHSL